MDAGGPSGTKATRRRSEHGRLRAIIEKLADGILIADANGQIRFANPAAQYMLGRSAADLIGSDFGFPVLREETTEIDLVRPGGSPITAELRVVQLDWEGEPASLISLRDITDRKEAERHAQALTLEQRARAEAEAASQAKSEFLAVMSHELRTPLNAVLGYAELLDLGLGGSLTDEQRQQVSRIRASGRHLLGLVNEVLDLARVEAGRLTVDRVPYRAASVAESALVIVQTQADAKGVTITRAYDRDSDLSYIGDEDRTRQILVNLLSNAVKFTRSGGRVSLGLESCELPHGQARLHGRGPWVCFRVADTGPGIATDRQEEIFAPFVQVHGGRTRNVDGSGLGLTISRRLARLMGGDLGVQSVEGQGSTFTLWLPATEEPASQAAGSQAPLSGRDPRVKGFADVGEAMLRELESLLDAIVNRLRVDPLTATAASLSYSQIADHIAALLADIASNLVVLEESAGEPSVLLADGNDIQRLIAERHGAQRGRLGWTEQIIRREHQIIREEVERSMMRHFLGETDGTLREALAATTAMLRSAEDISARALERSLRP